MRTVARYSFEADGGDADAALIHYLALADRLTTWLSWKGEAVYDGADNLTSVRYRDGREAAAVSQEVDVLPFGTYRSVRLTESTEQGTVFETTLILALASEIIYVYASLRSGGANQQPLGPLTYEARCPRVIRDFIGYALAWHYSGDPISKGKEKKRGRIEGEALATRITDPSRMLPLIIVSEYLGFVLHPDVTENLAQELIGLAHVCQIDEDASWGLTRKLGEQWSCFNGAIRLYWPRLDTAGDPFAHPLWTARKLLEFNADTKISADRLCSHLRKRLTELSSFIAREPSVIAWLAALDREKRFHAERARLEDALEFRQLAESYAAEVTELRTELTAKQEDIEDLRDRIEGLSFALKWKTDEESQAIEPESEIPPATVEEAVQAATKEAFDALFFGSDVGRGIQGLSPQAGPPEKVLHYLRALTKMGRARQSGPLGTSIFEWLKREGIKASQESETVGNSAEARTKRTFNDGHRDRFFEWHLKPSDAVSPDKCVRIYFDWSDELNKVVIAWVGRHPE
ncbi:MAG TPA: hypothetical protein VKK31_05850 [Thermoanaerobaculia bacterium]|nr:hypothetical protein [Thermoanaerobaculia bacterium]